MKNFNLAQEEYATIENSLKRMVATDLENKPILFLRIQDLNYENRFLLRKAVNQNPDHQQVLLSSNAKVSCLAWRMRAYHFLTYPVTYRQLKQLSYKMGQTGLKQRKLQLKYQGGMHLVKFEDIQVITGKGCYCKFYFKASLPSLYTMRIGDLYERCESIPFLIKVNRSLIVNINNISKIEGKAVFFGGSKPMKILLGERTIAKLKKEVLWI